MGKGDKKTRRGKIIIGSYGVRRRSHHNKQYIPTAKLSIPEKQAVEINQNKMNLDNQNISTIQEKTTKSASSKQPTSPKKEATPKTPSNKKSIKKEA